MRFFAVQPLILQGIERTRDRIENPRVGGSIPSRATFLNTQEKGCLLSKARK